MQLKAINREIQLLVEGNDGLRFFGAFLKHLHREDIQLQNFGGVNDLSAFLKAVVNAPGFQSQVKTLGIVRDAEDDAAAAWQSVQSAMRSADLILPDRSGAVAEGVLRTAVFILPDAQCSGMLETICLESVARDKAMPCVEDYMACLQQKGIPINKSSGQDAKARLHVFLASRDRPGLRLGEAADRGYWPFEDAAFSSLKSFLIGL